MVDGFVGLRLLVRLLLNVHKLALLVLHGIGNDFRFVVVLDIEKRAHVIALISQIYM